MRGKDHLPRPPRDVYFSARDGLRLYARHYPANDPDWAGRPLLCLAGLTRNGRDFQRLAEHLCTRRPRPRDVWCLDFRGRGRSAHDRDWRNYTPFVEMSDTLDLMTVVGLHGIGVLGTSRGGIVAMLMAAMRPGAMSALVLNDIGPVIEMRGVARIIGYAGKMPLPGTWDEAGMLIKEMNHSYFPHVSDEEWGEVAHQWFGERDGRPAPGYDPKLVHSLSDYNPSRPPPAFWPQFLAAGSIPVMAIRGSKSDLLSEETFDEMQVRHPNLQTAVVPDQGHAPLLRDEDTIGRIAAFLEASDPLLV